jgi:hypothetical protein
VEWDILYFWGIFFKYKTFQRRSIMYNFINVMYRAIKLICNRVIYGFESVCLLRLISPDLTCVSSCVYRSVEFK